MKPTATIRSLFIGIACSLLISQAASSDFNFEVALETDVHEIIMAELSKPILIRLKNGAHIIGHSVKLEDQKLLVGTSSEGGEARFTFDIHQLKHIQVPGKSVQKQALQALQSQDTLLARGILERLYYQRVNLLPLLSEAESQLFIAYAELVFAANDAAAALGICQKIQAQLNKKLWQRQLQLVILQCYDQLQLDQKSISLSQEFITANRWQQHDGLAYYVLAKTYYTQEAYQSSLATALEGIVLDTRPFGSYLNACYALAALSALKLKQLEYAHCLYSDMQKSSLEWPPSPNPLAESEKTLLQQLSEYGLQ